MKIVLLCTALVTMAAAQRPSYAGSAPIGRPGLANRFKDTVETTTTVEVPNRLGEITSTERIPVDALGDRELVDRLNQWPKEHQPFWLLNAQHIEAHRNKAPLPAQVDPMDSMNTGEGVNTLRPAVPPRSSFLSPRER